MFKIMIKTFKKYHIGLMTLEIIGIQLINILNSSVHTKILMSIKMIKKFKHFLQKSGKTIKKYKLKTKKKLMNIKRN